MGCIGGGATGCTGGGAAGCIGGGVSGGTWGGATCAIGGGATGCIVGGAMGTEFASVTSGRADAAGADAASSVCAEPTAVPQLIQILWVGRSAAPQVVQCIRAPKQLS